MRPVEVYIGTTVAVVNLSVSDRQPAVSLAANLPPRLEDPPDIREIDLNPIVALPEAGAAGWRMQGYDSNHSDSWFTNFGSPYLRQPIPIRNYKSAPRHETR